MAEQPAYFLETEVLMTTKQVFPLPSTTFNPTSPFPCPPVPVVGTIPLASIPVQVHSLLTPSLLNKVKGDYSMRHQGARGHRIHDFVCWIFFQVSLNSANKASWKISQNLGPAPFGQKWKAAPKPWTSWNSICYNITSGVGTWLFLSLSTEVFV